MYDNSMNKFLIILIFIISLVEASEGKLQNVNLQLQWKHQFEFAGFYMAQEKGFYKEVGLNVNFLEFTKNTNIVDTVLSSKADYGLSYSSIILDYMNQKPIIFVANFFKQSPLVLVTQKEITSLSQLKGAKIEGLANNIHNITLYRMLNLFDIKENDFITMTPSFKLDSFIKKEVDAISVFTTNEIFLLDEKGIEYNVFNPISYGAKYYDLNLFTSKSELKNNPKRVENFRSASIKGWEYALKHKEESINVILQKYNTQKKSKEALLFEAKQVKNIILDNVHKIGFIDEDKVQVIADNFVQAGFTDNKEKVNFKDFIFQASNINTLTQEDLDYLKTKESLSVCVDPKWMPFSAIVDNKYVGMDSDFIKIFEEKLGIPIDVYYTDSWSKSLGFAKAKKCDFVSMAVETEERKKYLNFTKPYFSFLNVLVTNMDKSLVTDIEYLKNKKIAVIQDYAEIEYIKTKYPNLEVLEVPNIREGLEKVKSKEVYGFIDNAFVIDYFFTKDDYQNFKIGHYLNDKSYLRLGIRNDDAKLHSIFEKIIREISFEEQEFIRSKWLKLSDEKAFDNDIFYQILILILVLFVVLMYRYYFVYGLNKELKIRVDEELKKSQDKDKMIFQQNKLIAMGEMIENIAHQWRQPLSQVNSCVLVIDDVLDEQGIRDKIVELKLKEIESLTKYMSNTINDFKNFFSQDKIKIDTVIEEVIEKTIDILKGRIESSNIKVEVDLRTAHKSLTHPNELQQVFLVILNNAIDILIEKELVSPSIRIKISRDSKYIYVNICDNAGGISEDKLDKVFEPYFTTKHKSQGTGLGLYISKLIVEDSLNGELSVKNNFSGACFTIKIKSNMLTIRGGNQR